MKRLFQLTVAAAFAAVLTVGCQKYDDTEIRQEIKKLEEKVSEIEAWCKDNQSAIDAVATLQKAVMNMNSVESVQPFEDGKESGYIITFTNGESIRLYNGSDGDTFFGNVNVGSSYVEFILEDGRRFKVDRVTNSIGFESYDTKAAARGDTIWTVMNPEFEKAEFAAFIAELKTDDGISTTITTKSANSSNPWKIEAIAPQFAEDGRLVKSAGVVVRNAPQAGGKCVLKATLVTNDGRETASSLVVDVTPNYLAFQAVEAGATVSLKINGQCDAPSLIYSTDLKVWTPYDFDNPQTIVLEKVGDKVYWSNADKAVRFSASDDNFIQFILGGRKIAAMGSIMSLLDKYCKMTGLPEGAQFNGLFRNNTSLVAAPELPALELAPDCYKYMFYGCASLANAPELPALKMERRCCVSMFQNCTSLTEAPALPATEIDGFCYSSMFKGCTALKKAPAVLPATKLDLSCYASMFKGCSSLKKAPALPATAVYALCYESMFADCTSLIEAPELPATDLDTFCYDNMFAGCSSLETAPALPATTLAEQCYYSMFCDCTSLKESPELPALTIAKECYYCMFYGCSSLTKASALPADKLYTDCYAGMYFECTSLETAPYLPAQKLVKGCYDSMFYGCSSLKSIKVAFTDWGNGTPTDVWTEGVSSAGTFECPEGLEVKYGDSYIPAGWSVTKFNVRT